MSYAAIPKLIGIGWLIMLKDKMNKYKLGVRQPRVVQVRSQNSFSCEIQTVYYKRTFDFWLKRPNQNSWWKEKILKIQTLLPPSFELDLLIDISILTHFIYQMLKLDSSLQLLSFLLALPLEYYTFQQALSYLFLLFPTSSVQGFFYRSNNIMYCGASATPAVAPCVPYPK